MTTADFIKTVGYHSLGGPESKEATYDITMLALQRGIPGDFVECGVYAGASSALMARAIMDKWSGNSGLEFGVIEGAMWSGPKVHLFDSFEGMPAATEVDEEQWAEHGDKTGMAKVSLPEVRANMARWGIPPELLVYHPGWFEQTIPLFMTTGALTGNRIAVLRLDADLYESTKAAMKLYPLVSPGGWIICDDFNLSGCRKAVNEVVNPAPVYWRKP